MGTPGKNPFHGQLTGGVAPAEAELLVVWAGACVPEGPEVEVESPRPTPPDAASAIQPQGSEAVVLAAPPAEDVFAELVVDEGAVETLVLDAAAAALGWPEAGAVPTAVPTAVPGAVLTGVPT